MRSIGRQHDCKNSAAWHSRSQHIIVANVDWHYCCRWLWRVEVSRLELAIAITKLKQNVLTIQRVVLESNQWRWQCKFNSSLNVRVHISHTNVSKIQRQQQQAHTCSQWCKIRLGFGWLCGIFFGFLHSRVNLRICNSTCFPCISVVNVVFFCHRCHRHSFYMCWHFFSCLFFSPFLCEVVCLQSFTYQNRQKIQ